MRVLYWGMEPVGRTSRKTKSYPGAVLFRVAKEILALVIIFSLLVGAFIIVVKYIPKEAYTWDGRLTSTAPESLRDLSDERRALFTDFDTFILDSAVERRRTVIELSMMTPGKLQALVRERLVAEISQTEVEEDSLIIWYLYNMGVIAKTREHTICFDLDSPSFAPDMVDMGKLCDVQTISHIHNDHSDTFSMIGTLNSGGTVVLDRNFGAVGDVLNGFVKEEYRKNLVQMDDREEISIEGVHIQRFVTGHRGSDSTENSWYVANIGGFTIVHTGDGSQDGRTFWELIPRPDVFLANECLVPFDLRDSAARYIVPLHLHEVGHDRSFLEGATFGSYLDLTDEIIHEFDVRGLDSVVFLMMWGERLEIERESV